MYQYVIRKYHLKTYIISTDVYKYIHHFLVHAPYEPISQYACNIIAQDRYHLLFSMIWYHIKGWTPVVKACTNIIVWVSVISGIINLVGFGNWCWWLISMDHYTFSAVIYDLNRLSIIDIFMPWCHIKGPYIVELLYLW